VQLSIIVQVGRSEIETFESAKRLNCPLLISGRADIEGVAEGTLRLGAAGFLVKPFDVYSLLNRIWEKMEGEVRTDHIKQLQP
jgi:FixJ family two-component response regulator